MRRDLNSPLLNAVSDVIAAIRTERFSHALDHLVSLQADYDLTAIFVYPQEQQPVLVHDGFRNHGTKLALDNYLKGTYLLDAVYQACVSNPSSGLVRMSELAPDAFFDSDYAKSWDVHPCISMNSGALAEELVYLVPLAGNAVAAYSVMRSGKSAPFSEEEFARLKAIEAIVCNAIERNWDGFVSETTDDGRLIWSRRGEAMEQGFETFASEILSPRERSIVRLILQGHSVLSMARNLEIAEGTVKNHKKNIYAKMGISSQSELFSRFVQHVCGG